MSPQRERECVCNFLSDAPLQLITVCGDLPTEMHNAGALPSIMQHLFIPQQYLIDLILFASCIIEQACPRVCFLSASGCFRRPRSITEAPEILKLQIKNFPFWWIMDYRYVRVDGWILSFINDSKASAAKCFCFGDTFSGLAWKGRLRCARAASGLSTERKPWLN